MDTIYPDAPGFKGEAETSRDAANDMAEHCSRIQKLVRGAIRAAGPDGLTADELADELGLNRWTVQPRTSELRRKGLIKDSGQRRRNVTGKRAIVWTEVQQAGLIGPGGAA